MNKKINMAAGLGFVIIRGANVLGRFLVEVIIPSRGCKFIQRKRSLFPTGNMQVMIVEVFVNLALQLLTKPLARILYLVSLILRLIRVFRRGGNRIIQSLALRFRKNETSRSKNNTTLFRTGTLRLTPVHQQLALR